MGDKQKVKKAFDTLRKRGYFAQMNFWHCPVGAWSAMTDEQAKKTVFYTAQDRESGWDKKKVSRWDKKKLSEQGLCLTWAGDGEEICQVFRDNGLNVEWDGSKNTKIKITGIVK